MTRPKRRYSSALRAEQARQTRLTILDAASKLFLADGYAETSIRAIAREAGVAERTVYIAFGDKISIVTAIADRIRFGETPEGEGMAQFIESLKAVPDPMERLRTVVHRGAVGRERGLAVLAQMVKAAARSDARARAFLAGGLEYRHRSTRVYAEVVLGHPLPDGAATEQLVDELEVILSEEVYLLFTDERGWSREAYERYVVEMILIAMRRHGVELT